MRRNHGARNVEDVLARVGLRADPLVVERIADLGATHAEVYEAIAVHGTSMRSDPEPSSSRVAEIRALLAELLEVAHPRRW